MKKVTKAVIPLRDSERISCRLQNRFRKKCLPIVDKPTIQYIIEEIVDSGIKDILIINGRNKVVMVNHFDNVPGLEFH